MTTDSGVDLVAYLALRGRSWTLQVKANLVPKPGGGKGVPSLDWWLPDKCPAELIALVDISTQAIWLFTRPELEAQSRQHPEGRCHFYMYMDPVATSSKAWGRSGRDQYSRWLLANQLDPIFGS